jgi:hypothetical protein
VWYIVGYLFFNMLGAIAQFETEIRLNDRRVVFNGMEKLAWIEGQATPSKPSGIPSEMKAI